MNLSLSPEMERFITREVAEGRYARPEDVVQAGLEALIQHEAFGDFAPGELDGLLAEGERSIAEHGGVPAESVFTELRQRGVTRDRGSA